MSFEPPDASAPAAPPAPPSATDDWSGFAPPGSEISAPAGANQTPAGSTFSEPSSSSGSGGWDRDAGWGASAVTVPDASAIPAASPMPPPPVVANGGSGSSFPLGGVAPWATSMSSAHVGSAPPYSTKPATLGGLMPAPPALLPPTPPLGGSAPSSPTMTIIQPANARRTMLLGVLVGALVASVIAAGVYVSFGRATTTVISQPARPSTVIAGATLDIQALLKKVRPSVVSIKTGIGGRGEAAGSGIVISTDGMVLTNAHVISGATAISVTFADGKAHDATLVGSFPDNDVALVQAKDSGATVPAELGSSDALLVGDDVVAIGNALNLGADPSVTKGIVSAKDRSIQAESENLDHLIQTDAAINPGNSGGPLVNAKGQVVGINTAIIQSSQNVGFSLAIDSIKPLIDELKSGKGTVNGDTPFLGVVTTDIADQPADVLQTWNVAVDQGAFVSGIQPDSAAEVAGLEEGDVITAIDGKTVANKQDVGTIIRGHQAGDSIRIAYLRRGKSATAQAVLKKRGG